VEFQSYYIKQTVRVVSRNAPYICWSLTGTEECLPLKPHKATNNIHRYHKEIIFRVISSSL